MSFRHLTSGQRKALQRGLLSGEEAAAVSSRNNAKSQAQGGTGFGGFVKSIIGNTGFQILGFTRVLDNLAASYFTGGLATPLIQPLQGALGLRDPYVQAGIIKNPRDAALASTLGNAVAGFAGAVGGYGPQALYSAGKGPVGPSFAGVPVGGFGSDVMGFFSTAFRAVTTLVTGLFTSSGATGTRTASGSTIYFTSSGQGVDEQLGSATVLQGIGGFFSQLASLFNSLFSFGGGGGGYEGGAAPAKPGKSGVGGIPTPLVFLVLAGVGIGAYVLTRRK